MGWQAAGEGAAIIQMMHRRGQNPGSHDGKKRLTDWMLEGVGGGWGATWDTKANVPISALGKALFIWLEYVRDNELLHTQAKHEVPEGLPVGEAYRFIAQW